MPGMALQDDLFFTARLKFFFLLSSGAEPCTFGLTDPKYLLMTECAGPIQQLIVPGQAAVRTFLNAFPADPTLTFSPKAQRNP